MCRRYVKSRSEIIHRGYSASALFRKVVVSCPCRTGLALRGLSVRNPHIEHDIAALSTLTSSRASRASF